MPTLRAVPLQGDDSFCQWMSEMILCVAPEQGSVWQLEWVYMMYNIQGQGFTAVMVGGGLLIFLSSCFSRKHICKLCISFSKERKKPAECVYQQRGICKNTYSRLERTNTCAHTLTLPNCIWFALPRRRWRSAFAPCSHWSSPAGIGFNWVS